MERIAFKTPSGLSEIFIGSYPEKIESLIDPARTVIITDSNVESVYGNTFPDSPVITVPAGEQSKCLDVVEMVLNSLLEAGADRSTFILGIGGGVVSDITGFVASVYMRGVRFGFVSTTLLSQVDAGIGGKNGVNLGQNKNIVGTFSQPEFVICDPAMLSTLPHMEFVSGLGEVVKHALIKDRLMLGFIEENIDLVLKGDASIMLKLIAASIRIKTTIVASDEKEQGDRRLLNFGHTAGHPIELLTQLPHGMAVAHGMMIAAELSYDEGLLQLEDLGRIESLLGRLGLLQEINILPGSVGKILLGDKKRENERIHFIYLKEPGNAYIKPVPIGELIGKLTEKGL